MPVAQPFGTVSSPAATAATATSAPAPAATISLPTQAGQQQGGMHPDTSGDNTIAESEASIAAHSPAVLQAGTPEQISSNPEPTTGSSTTSQSVAEADQPVQWQDPSVQQPPTTSAAQSSDANMTPNMMSQASTQTSSARTTDSKDGPSSTSSTEAVAEFSVASADGAPSTVKEAQLTRLLETLRKRLDAYKAENQQLEDLLHATESRASQHLQRATEVEATLSSMQAEYEATAAATAATATAQNAQISRLRQELDGATRQIGTLQASYVELQEQHSNLMSTKDSIEGGALEGVHHCTCCGAFAPHMHHTCQCAYLSASRKKQCKAQMLAEHAPGFAQLHTAGVNSSWFLR